MSFLAGGTSSNIVIRYRLPKPDEQIAFFVCSHYECATRDFRHLPAMSIKTTLHATAPLLYPCWRYPKCRWGLFSIRNLRQKKVYARYTNKNLRRKRAYFTPKIKSYGLIQKKNKKASYAYLHNRAML